jgi:hypothetical protein
MRGIKRAICLLGIISLASGIVIAQGQRPAPNPSQSVKGHFAGVNRRILEMAKDYPADKYDFRLKPEMRSFGEVIVHIASGNVYAAKAGRGEKVKWDELNPKDFPTKEAVVALMEKSISDAQATISTLPDEAFTKSVEPWLEVLEHSAEHYGLLVAYYRANGLVPPASRPKTPAK